MAEEIQQHLEGITRALLEASTDLIAGEIGVNVDPDFLEAIYKRKDTGDFLHFPSEEKLIEIDITKKSGAQFIGVGGNSFTTLSGDTNLQAVLEDIDFQLNNAIGTTVVDQTLTGIGDELLETGVSTTRIIRLNMAASGLVSDFQAGLKAGAFDGHTIVIYIQNIDDADEMSMQIDDSVTGSVDLESAHIVNLQNNFNENADEGEGAGRTSVTITWSTDENSWIVTGNGWSEPIDVYTRTTLEDTSRTLLANGSATIINNNTILNSLIHDLQKKGVIGLKLTT